MSKRSEAVKEWRKNNKQRMIDSMGGKCVVCCYNKCNAALEFHHLDPNEKELGLGGIRANPKAWSKIVEELRKCVLVCANCHREIHDGSIALPENITSFDETFADYRQIETKMVKDKCPVCGGLKATHQVTCSRSCASKHRYPTDWHSVDIVSLVQSGMSYEALGRQLSVSGNAVRKRYQKLLKQIRN